jgi:hypothetical protein
MEGSMHGRSSMGIAHSSFREEDFLEIDQSKIRIACGNHVC